MSSSQRRRNVQCPGPSRSSQHSSQRLTSSQSSQQNSQGEGSSQSTALSAEEFNNLVSEVVQYILVQNQHKGPIKLLDIKKNVLKARSRIHKDVINEAKCVLLQIFGFRLVEVEPDTSNSYILVNTIANFTPSEEEEPNYVLLLVVLSLIFMSGGCIDEDRMWRLLTALKILEDNVPHPYFGDTHKLLTQDLVKKLYLKYTRIAGTDPVKYEFRWGRRAEEELSKKTVLEFVGKVFGQTDVSVWSEQYQEAMNEEQI